MATFEYKGFIVSSKQRSGAFTALCWRKDGRFFSIDGHSLKTYETMTKFAEKDALADSMAAIDGIAATTGAR
jgi:hypothetical protein